jgi:hypothetical protein
VRIALQNEFAESQLRETEHLQSLTLATFSSSASGRRQWERGGGGAGSKIR